MLNPYLEIKFEPMREKHYLLQCCVQALPGVCACSINYLN